MIKAPHFKSSLLMLMLCAVLARPVAAAEENLQGLERQFKELPPAARRQTGPLFWLHGDETKAQLEGELRKVVQGGNGTFTAESRPHQDWLGEGWYRDLGICLDFAKKNDLTMWIFDEKWWPSGEIGGKVPAQYASKRLAAEAAAVAGPARFTREGLGGNLVAVLAGRVTGGAIDGASLIDLTDRVRAGKLAWDAPAGAWSVMAFTWTLAPKTRGNYLVDGSSKDSVEWYIKTVYQPHYDRFGNDFGKTIKGYFYDEPETPGDWGTEVIPLLKSRGVDWKKALVAWKFTLAGDEQAAAKYQYQDARAEAWGRTLYGGLAQWCHEHNVTSMGHFLEHDWEYYAPKLCAGNMFQLQKYSDLGAIDLVFRQLPPGQRPMGMLQMAKLGSSITHVNGKKDDVTMVEIFGARGQDLPYPEMKWNTDQMQVSGVNFLIPHSFNPRAPYDTDCPPYFYDGGFEPRWPLYRVFADYTSRLSLMLSGGRHVAPVAFLFMGNSVHVGKVVKPEEMTTALQDALYDCDWLPYDTFENDAKLAGKEVKLHQESYRVLIVPPVEVIPYGALAKARDFFEQGGVVVGYGFLPGKSATLDKSAGDIAALTQAIWGSGAQPGLAATKTNAAGGRAYLLPEQPTPEQLQQALAGDARIHPTLEVQEGRTDHWLHVLHRVKAGRDVFFVTNQNLTGGARAFKFRVTAPGEPECWDALRNEITAPAYRRIDPNTVEIALTLEANESTLLVFQPEKRNLPPRLDGAAKTLRELEVRRDPSATEPEPPRLKTAESAVPDANQVFQGSPWVWFPEPGARGTTAPPGTRYFRAIVNIAPGRQIAKASFHLTADNEFVMTVNGKQAGANAGDEAWRNVQHLDLTGLLQPGQNLIAIKAVNATDQPSPAGLIGAYTIQFAQGPAQAGRIDRSWKVSNTPQPGWDQRVDFDDRPWAAAREVAAYGASPWGRLGRSQRVTVGPVAAAPFTGFCELPAGLDLTRARVCLVADTLEPEAAARVTINGRDAGGFIGQPLRLDVTQYLARGRNTIRVEPFTPQGLRLAVFE